MRILFIITLALIAYINLSAEWEEVEKGYVSTDTLIGNKRYVLEENALVLESKYSIKKVDLNTGNIIKEIIFDDTTHSIAVADDNLDNVYLFYDSILNSPKRYEYHIVDYRSNDTLLTSEKGLPRNDPVIESNLSLLNDSLLIISGKIDEVHPVLKSTKPFFNIVNVNNNSPIKESNDYGLYFERYNLWNPRSNTILGLYDYYYTEGSKGGASNVKLKYFLLDSLLIYNMKEHRTSSDEGYVPRAHFISFGSSNKDSLIYFDYYYYITEYSPSGEISYSKHYLNLVLEFGGNVIKYFDFHLGDYVTFTTDDKWLVATKMKGENSVDFKVFSLEGELIFTDSIPNVTSEQIICYTDSTYFFEAGNKILMYNPFENNLTNVSEEDIDNLIEVYPNPTSKFLNIKLPETNLSSEVTIIDQQGSIKETLSLNYEALQNNQYKLDVSLYPAGMYFLRIRTNNKTSTSKFIKI